MPRVINHNSITSMYYMYGKEGKSGRISYLPSEKRRIALALCVEMFDIVRVGTTM